MENFLGEASSKGYHVVDNNKLNDCYSDYNEINDQANQLLERIDSEDQPFHSKYQARTLLDTLCNKLEANRTIASLEKNSLVIQELNWRIAEIRLKLGGIAWDVEEPHNTQIELEPAAVRKHFQFFCIVFFLYL